MAKTKTKVTPIPFAMPIDSNRNFVVFSRILTAGTLAVSIESLLNQIRKNPSDRQVTEIIYDPATLKFTIDYEVMT